MKRLSGPHASSKLWSSTFFFQYTATYRHYHLSLSVSSEWTLSLYITCLEPYLSLKSQLKPTWDYITGNVNSRGDLRNHLTVWFWFVLAFAVFFVSEACSFAKAAKASGKLGGVAGVFAGVTSCSGEMKCSRILIHINKNKRRRRTNELASKTTYRVVRMARNGRLLKEQT